MPDAILVKDGAVTTVARNCDDPAVFGPEPDGVVHIVDSALGVCGGQLWDGETASDPYVEPPPEPRRLIPKSVVQERVHAAGKLADVMAVLRSEGQEIAYARWFAPDWPRVYFDDEAMLALLAFVGCTEEEIETITAPV